jgi:hypothetical protein
MPPQLQQTQAAAGVFASSIVAMRCTSSHRCTWQCITVLTGHLDTIVRLSSAGAHTPRTSVPTGCTRLPGAAAALFTHKALKCRLITISYVFLAQYTNPDDLDAASGGAEGEGQPSANWRIFTDKKLHTC